MQDSSRRAIPQTIKLQAAQLGENRFSTFNVLDEIGGTERGGGTGGRSVLCSLSPDRRREAQSKHQLQSMAKVKLTHIISGSTPWRFKKRITLNERTHAHTHLVTQTLSYGENIASRPLCSFLFSALALPQPRLSSLPIISTRRSSSRAKRHSSNFSRLGEAIASP